MMTTGVMRISGEGIVALAQELSDAVQELQEQADIQPWNRTAGLPDHTTEAYQALLVRWRVRLDRLAEESDAITDRAATAGQVFIKVEQDNAASLAGGAAK